MDYKLGVELIGAVVGNCDRCHRHGFCVLLTCFKLPEQLWICTSCIGDFLIEIGKEILRMHGLSEPADAEELEIT